MPDVSLILNKASFLNPLFKSLADKIDEVTQILHMAAQPVHSTTEQESEGSPVGEKYQTEPLSTGVVAVSREELVQVDVSRYKIEPPLRLSKRVWNGGVLTEMVFLIWL